MMCEIKMQKRRGEEGGAHPTRTTNTRLVWVVEGVGTSKGSLLAA